MPFGDNPTFAKFSVGKLKTLVFEGATSWETLTEQVLRLRCETTNLSRVRASANGRGQAQWCTSCMQPAKSEPRCGVGIAGLCLILGAVPQLPLLAPDGSANIKAMIPTRVVTTSGKCANRGGTDERVPHLRNLLFGNRSGYRLVAALLLLTKMRRGGCEKNPGGGGSSSTIGCVRTSARDSTGPLPNCQPAGWQSQR
jgi:hypothetical protein